MNGRTIAVVVGISTASGLCSAAALVAGLIAFPQVGARFGLLSAMAKTISVDTITAHRFTLIDDKGRTIATLRTWKDGTAGLVFVSEQKLEDKSSGFLSTVGDDLRLTAAAGIVVWPGFPGQSAAVFVNSAKADGQTSRAGVAAEYDSSSLALSQPPGPAIKISVGDQPKTARIELTSESNAAGWPDRLEPVKYVRLDADGLEVHDEQGKTTVSAHAFALSDLHTVVGREKVAELNELIPGSGDKSASSKDWSNEPILSFHSQSRAVLGVTDLEAVRTGEQTTTAPSSLILFDKRGNVILHMP